MTLALEKNEETSEFVSGRGVTVKRQVCMFVFNNFTNDSRVEKEAETLVGEGYEVTVFAVLDKQTKALEERNGIKIRRVQLTPWHLRFIRWLKKFEQRPQKKKVRKRKGRFSRYKKKVAVRVNKEFHKIYKRLVPDKLPPLNYFGTTFLYLLLFALFMMGIHTPAFHSMVEAHGLVINLVIVSCILFRKIIKNFLIQKFRKLLLILKSGFKMFHSLCFKSLFLVERVTKSMKKTLNKKRAAVLKIIKNNLMRYHRHFSFLSFYKNVNNALQFTPYDIYHAHDLNTLPVAWYLSRKHRGKLIYDSHELYVDRNKLVPSSWMWKFILRRIEKFLSRRCNAVFTVNESLALELKKKYKLKMPGVIMNTPASFANNEIPLMGNDRLRRNAGVPEDKKLVVYVGGITFNRGLEALIRSLLYLPDCYLVCMGYGTDAYKKSLLKLVSEIGVQDRFSFFGPVPGREVIHYATGADLGVAPIANACKSYFLCSPNKLFEYMNAGLPVIASNFPELEKVVLGHAIGFTFDPENPLDIAAQARKILDNPDMAAKMRKNALKSSGFYNWGNESKKLLSIYESLYEN
ncbi:glycosyltransferase [Desulfobotulus sp. H1]|uniref:Glycosyltransferase n=1 Tax=Desulfobotulus pelophilus TaxID=2823377 RepID=A0ABT3NEF9_9BACT|nr:glycosyltransferase [Desulfobotulus pelophilus]MCW7755282.1 glycosyltransferase [Desulfobotulus pelophilus]